MAYLNEDTVEQAALDWLRELGYDTRFGPDIAPGERAAERASYDEVLLLGRLRAALARLNPGVPPSALDEAIRKIQRAESQNPAVNNHAFHRLLTEGVDVAYHLGGQLKHGKVWLVDFNTPQNNEWLAVNQFTVTGANLATMARTNRRPDIVLFVNGLPLAVIELKNPADETATIRRAYNQLQTYKDDIPALFTFNEALVIADGPQARLGTLTAGWEWFKPWRTVAGDALAPPEHLQLEVLVKGVFAPHRFLDLVRYFTVFEADGGTLKKKIAAYHQYHAVNRAVEKTVEAASPRGDQRVGVVWHTQGSGKSLSMLFYAGKVIQHPAMQNPTLIVLTDRNDLDDQLFDTFAAGHELLRQEPRQAQSRDHLRQLLQVASGGVVFTTIQKFRPEENLSVYPLLSDRHNIVFIADEAHRSQYGFSAHMVQTEREAYLAYGFAKYVRDALPNASFVGFTGTPIESTDVNTPLVFGDYIDIYDIHRAVEDGATVPIYYEARLAPLHLKDEMRAQIDPEFDAITEGEELEGKERLKSKWSQLEAMVGTAERLERIAADIVGHFEQRCEAMDGKGLIVCMSRRIAVDLYQQIVRIRPEWHSLRDEEGAIKVVMTGSAGDPAHYQLHIRDFASTVPADASNNYWSNLDSKATWGSVTTAPVLSAPVSYGEHSGESEVCFVPKPPRQIDFTNIRFKDAHAALKSLMFWLIWNETSEDRFYFGGDAQIGTANSPITDQRDQISRQLASFLIDTPYCANGINQASGEQLGTLNWDGNVVRIEHCEDHRYMMAQVLINAFIDYERKVTWYDPDVPEQLMAAIYPYGYVNFGGSIGSGQNDLWKGYRSCKNFGYFGDWPKTLISRDTTTPYHFTLYNDFITRIMDIERQIAKCGNGDECLASFPYRWQVQALAVLWLDEYFNCYLNIAPENDPYWIHFQDASPRIVAQIDRAIDDFYAQKPDPTDRAWGRLNANRLPTDNPHTISLATGSLGLDSPQADVKNLYDERPGGTGVCPLTKSEILNYIHSPAMDHIDQVRDCYPPINPVVLQPLLWLDVSAAEAQTPAGYKWATASYVRLQGEHLQRYVDICATYGRCLDGQSQ